MAETHLITERRWPAIDVSRQINESPLEYHKRIVYGKLVDKTLADVDYTELSELAYGQSYSSDVARRMFYGSRRTLELMDAERGKRTENDGLMSELDEKMRELRKERQKFYDQRREYNKLVAMEARNEHLYEALINAADNLKDTVGCMYDSSVGCSDAHSDAEAILVFSDWHFGLKTENVFNKFDTEICRERVRRVVEAAVERIKLHSCQRLHIVVLGDLYHGAIHTSARVASEEYVCDQLMQASEILAQSIECLSHYVDETIVYMTYGNHARTVQNKEDSIHRDNMERIVPWWLTQKFSQANNIVITTGDTNEFLFINACGHEICAVHGDNDSVKTSPRLLTTLFHKTQGRNIEYILLGDKHHRESFDELGVSALLCGSLCGTDDYANNKRLYSEPSQLLLIATPTDGIDAEYRIKCR